MAKKDKKLIKAIKAARRKAQLTTGVNLSTRVAQTDNKKKDIKKARRDAKKEMRNGNFE